MPVTSTSGQGRPKGSLNKATADVKALAGKYSGEAIKALAKLAGLVEGEPSADTDAAKVAALRELLDRGHGKPAQSMELSGELDTKHRVVSGVPLTDMDWEAKYAADLAQQTPPSKPNGTNGSGH